MDGVSDTAWVSEHQTRKYSKVYKNAFEPFHFCSYFSLLLSGAIGLNNPENFWFLITPENSACDSCGDLFSFQPQFMTAGVPHLNQTVWLSNARVACAQKEKTMSALFWWLPPLFSPHGLYFRAVK